MTSRELQTWDDLSKLSQIGARGPPLIPTEISHWKLVTPRREHDFGLVVLLAKAIPKEGHYLTVLIALPAARVVSSSLLKRDPVGTPQHSAERPALIWAFGSHTKPRPPLQPFSPVI